MPREKRTSSLRRRRKSKVVDFRLHHKDFCSQTSIQCHPVHILMINLCIIYDINLSSSLSTYTSVKNIIEWEKKVLLPFSGLLCLSCTLSF